MLMVPTLPLKPLCLPDFVRARGGVRIVIGPTSRGSAPLTMAESGGYRVRFPKAKECEGVLINTGGGTAGGDRMSVEATLRPGAAAVLTTQAAEKVYRSDGPDAEVAIALNLETSSRLDWLPQEQILFSGARLRRTLDVAMGGDATLMLLESVVFGRAAMGETPGEGAFRDRWRVRRDGRLVFAEDVRLEGAIGETLRRKAAGAGARALATFLYVAPDAEARREQARAALQDACSECGASAWSGMLIARFMSQDAQALRSDLLRFVERFRGIKMPRSWQT
jgi:urease accessory protein